MTALLTRNETKLIREQMQDALMPLLPLGFGMDVSTIAQSGAVGVLARFNVHGVPAALLIRIKDGDRVAEFFSGRLSRSGVRLDVVSDCRFTLNPDNTVEQLQAGFNLLKANIAPRLPWKSNLFTFLSLNYRFIQ